MLQLQEAADHRRKLLSEFLDGREYKPCSLDRPLGQEIVEALLTDLIGRLLAERVLPNLPQALAPAI